MTRTAKIAMIILALGAALYGLNANAGIRCGNTLIEPGDPQYQAERACGEPEATHKVGSGANSSGDEGYSYHNINNKVVQFHYIDGHLYSIGNDENIH